MRTDPMNPTSNQSRNYRTMLLTGVLALSSIVGFGTRSFARTPSAPMTACAMNSANHGDPQAHINERIEKMTKHLGLTADQATQVRAIMQKNQPTMKADHQAVKAATDATRAAAKAQFMTDRQAALSEIRAVLTPAQQTKFDAFQAKHHKHE